MAATSIDLSQIKTDALDSKATFKTLIEAEGVVETIVAGTGITVDDTDPANPIVTATGGSVSLDNLREYFPTIANNSTDSEHDLDIGAARIWVSDGTDERIVNFAAEVKRIDAAWAAGTNQGGLDTGTVANSTWYYIWAIYNPTTDVAGYLLSASASSPTMPSGYTYKRLLLDRIASAVLTNGSANVLTGIFAGDTFLFAELIININTTSPLLALTEWTPSVPPIGKIEWLGSCLAVVSGAIANGAHIVIGYDSTTAGRTIGGNPDAVSRSYTQAACLTKSGKLHYTASRTTGWTLFQLRTEGYRCV